MQTKKLLLIVAVFDPLALVLILAAQQSIKWAREDKQETDQDAHKRIDQELAETKQDIDTTLAPKYEPDDGPLTDSQVEQIKTTVAEKYPYLNQPFVHFKDLKPMVAAPPKPEVVPEPEPVLANTTTLDVPATPTVTLPLAVTRTFELPFWIDVASIPVKNAPLPRK